ncbi:hypothetical protein EUBDOL_00660 [Amedibacillus dolichus DSM 3991]|uniref:Uncharacterized protein n=1 Tax=Amedibacillus dolichus DSM 3991 TaxID=428127 RepID=A8R9Z6_9FIRM|nr:hypothetical protein EUBDOL_00660 [Amedibacillus dolichus DSM 3991]
MCTVCFISRYKEAVSYKITNECQAFFCLSCDSFYEL